MTKMYMRYFSCSMNLFVLNTDKILETSLLILGRSYSVILCILGRLFSETGLAREEENIVFKNKEKIGVKCKPLLMLAEYITLNTENHSKVGNYITYKCI